jgi:inner membrane transporter RhtA
MVSVQFGAALAASLFDENGPAAMSLLRIAFAAAILLAVWRPRLRDHAPTDLRLAALFGLTLGVMNLTFYEAIARLPLGVAVTIQFVGPLGVAVAGSRRRLDLLWALLAAAGVVLLAQPGGGGIDPAGLAFILVAAAGWAAYILVAVRAGQRFSGGTGLALAMAVAVAVPAVPGIAEGGSHLLSPPLLAAGLAIGLLSSVIPYSVETEALRRMPQHVFGVLMSLEPAVAAVAGLFVLGQHLDVLQFVAIGLVIAASTGAARSPAARVPAEA